MPVETSTERVRATQGTGRSGRWPNWTLGLIVAAFAVTTIFGTAGDVSSLVLGFFALWIPVAVCWIAIGRARSRRKDLYLMSAAVTILAAGDTFFALATTGGNSLSNPSWADVGFLGFYPLMFTALVVLARRNIRGLASPIVLDSAVGSLGAAALLAVLLDPILKAALAAPGSFATTVAFAYPLGDVLLIAFFVGIAASHGTSIGPGWTLLVLGLAVFTAADIISVSLHLNGLYVLGTALDVGWPLSLALIASSVDREARLGSQPRRSTWAIPEQTVPAIATAAGLLVLILGTQLKISPLAVVLAALTLTLAALPLVFRQRIRIADAHRQARTDELTGLPNRRALYADVPARLAANPLRTSALLLLDLDKFKEVNDSLGHDVGDLLLFQVAGRISGQLRTEDLFARVGGDEFVIFLDGSDSVRAEAVALKLRATLAQPFILAGISVQASASIGIAGYPDQGEDLTMLLRKADMAKYTAKATHSGHHVYRGTDDHHGEERLHLLEELRLALVDDQLVMHYQPKIDLKTGDVCGVEALVRWNHPTRGLLQPDDFLGLVEESGLMHAMTEIVLHQALDQAASWSAQGRTLTMAVNMSPSSLIDTVLPERISAMLSSRGLSPAMLVLEITEDFLLSDRERARSILTRLQATGIRISIDDFGTGYSSLAYLRDLPIDELKLDKSFIIPMKDDPRATALVVSTIDLAHSLGLRMVAEGVEDTTAYSELIGYGCDVAQGFLLSHPVPAAELEDWLAARALDGSALGQISG
ncbi:putative bifunctional diguanylate cyclase/phosphodiesterase [Cryobacterium sp. 5B3]|uniref:putative bifunctional diguanylate cyclase/phosphodiesterase n=1 Tax=Cryobacterium sp. 5B3 TaxID=3048586 RepID=UPI002AB52CFA|nr:EAL domain-containing protein [Cryobacterium sp. 5B3]MDY7544315.1 EAL domain-containing protein [Cryobacterium sp. 5B3]MEB0276176.1 EAL domain-containing protein [Cryobacterium sp. 5B3]